MAISLRDITFETVRTVLALEVAQVQRDYVASNAVSLAEALFNPGAWYRAVYADEIPVGFVMLFDPMVPGAIARSPMEPTDIGLWRFMIDHRHQRRGYGRGALEAVRSRIRGRPGGARLISSYRPGAHGPEQFYLRHGFMKTGRLRANGTEVEIWLAP